MKKIVCIVSFVGLVTLSGLAIAAPSTLLPASGVPAAGIAQAPEEQSYMTDTSAEQDKKAGYIAVQSTAGDLTNDKITFRSKTEPIFCSYPVPQGQWCKNQLYATEGTRIRVIQADPISGLDYVQVSSTPSDPCISQKSCISDNGRLFVVHENKMLFYPRERDGMVWGMLTVPYKYHMGAGQITSEASVGGYLGYSAEVTDWGISFNPIISIGMAPLSIPVVQGTTTTTTSVTAYHWAIGALFTFQKRTGFQAGIVYGKDYVFGVTPYQYNKQGWFALALGYGFQ